MVKGLYLASHQRGWDEGGCTHQELGTEKIKEGDWPFLRNQNATVSSCGESLGAKKQDCCHLATHGASVKPMKKTECESRASRGRWWLSISSQAEG